MAKTIYYFQFRCPLCNERIRDESIPPKEEDLLNGIPYIFPCKKCNESLIVQWNGERERYLVSKHEEPKEKEHFKLI